MRMKRKGKGPESKGSENKSPRESGLTAAASFLLVAKLFLKKAPAKVAAECTLSAMSQILVVVNSVWLLECLTDMVIAGKAFTDALKVLVPVVGINILASVLQNFYDACIRPGNDLKMKRYLEERLMEHAENLALCHYENSTFYTTVRQAQNVVSDTVFAAYSDLIQISGNAAALISAAAVAAAIHAGLLLFIVFTIPMILVSRKYGRLLSEKKLELAFWDRKKQYAKDAWMSKELARVFRITNAWRIADKHYEEGHQGSTTIHRAYGLPLFGWNLLGTEVSITLIMFACYLYGILASAYSGSFSLSGFPVLFVAVMNMISRIRKLYRFYENFCGYGVQLKALQDFEELEPEDGNPEGLVPEPFESLEFCHVWFSYDGVSWALRNVSFQMKAGEKVSVLGYNGAGKSTLIKLLLRFYPTGRGEILYNGVNIERYRLAEYRKAFSAAFQDCRLFSFSLAENICMEACSKGREQEVREALRRMGRKDLAADTGRILGREYDGEGLVLSGGQQQWITVSRLYFAGFEIAVLDEPSAALDPISAGQMRDEMFRFVGGRSMLLVSHDMSVTRHVDRILFFDRGELAAQGTHEELMGQSGKYALFYECQARNYRGG